MRHLLERTKLRIFNTIYIFPEMTRKCCILTAEIEISSLTIISEFIPTVINWKPINVTSEGSQVFDHINRMKKIIYGFQLKGDHFKRPFFSFLVLTGSYPPATKNFPSTTVAPGWCRASCIGGSDNHPLPEKTQRFFSEGN